MLRKDTVADSAPHAWEPIFVKNSTHEDKREKTRNLMTKLMKKMMI